ncbi:DUF262 domain-containing protein [Paenibacillus sp. Aloe-11]|uniref:DUF262 domain-containing protein n=1 Tax=Paenibacillus sp. Aloe-11 TaxID=1050222 RepID=UPI0002FCD745|nr:DUF262 domain-containing protein [Paenibacillus sp. Aloe-11]
MEEKEKKTLVLSRNTNNITISEFYENHSLDKYNYSPPYQRRGDAWSIEKQAFLIDSIIKNYPIPPIFLHAKIEAETGKTFYDVIDGKQRLTSIVKFINDEIELPENFGDDKFGSEDLNGLKFSEINAEFKSNFWKYKIPIEYVDTDNVEVVNTIFDRLNRNGEPLNRQELRHAQYNNSKIIKLVQDLSKIDYWKIRASEYLDTSRMEDDEFISELLFTLLEDDVVDSKPETLDTLYSNWNKTLIENDDIFKKVTEEFKTITAFLEGLTLDYKAYKIEGVSHLYGLWGLSTNCVRKNIPPERIKVKLLEFFSLLRNKDYSNEPIRQYKNSMSYNTRSKGQRQRRLNALVIFCEI